MNSDYSSSIAQTTVAASGSATGDALANEMEKLKLQGKN